MHIHVLNINTLRNNCNPAILPHTGCGRYYQFKPHPHYRRHAHYRPHHHHGVSRRGRNTAGHTADRSGQQPSPIIVQ